MDPHWDNLQEDLTGLLKREGFLVKFVWFK